MGKIKNLSIDIDEKFEHYEELFNKQDYIINLLEDKILLLEDKIDLMKLIMNQYKGEEL